MISPSTLGMLNLTLRLNIEAQFSGEYYYGICPREGIVCQNPDLAIEVILHQTPIIAQGVSYPFLKADASVSQILSQYPQKRWQDRFIGAYLQDHSYEKGILLIRADNKLLTPDENCLFATAQVENSPDKLFQTVSYERKLQTVFLFSPEDYSAMARGLMSRGGGSTRIFNAIFDIPSLF